MIKIHDKIWYVIRPDDKNSLAYMTNFEKTKHLTRKLKPVLVGRA
jgi:hypothetical protein